MKSSRQTQPRSNFSVLKQIGLTLLILAIVGYRFYSQSTNESTDSTAATTTATAPVETEDPLNSSLAESTDPVSDSGERNAVREKQPYLRTGERGALVSPAGLIYTRTNHGEHRSAHVLRHARDMPDRRGSHGVFQVREDDEVFALIDEAYQLIQTKSDRVRVEPSRGDGKQAYVVDMNRTIGYKGGQAGKQSGNPKLSRIKLVLAENRVVTAFPY